MSKKKTRQLRAFIEQKDGSFIANPEIRRLGQPRKLKVIIEQNTKPKTRKIKIAVREPA